MYLELDDEKYLEIDDGLNTKDADAFDEMCRQMLAAYSEMDSAKFRELMYRQLATLGPNATIADLCRRLMEAGVAPGKSWGWGARETFDIDERELATAIAQVIAAETGAQVRAAFNQALGRLD